MTIPPKSSIKCITDVLLVFEFNQNLLNVGHMLEKKYALHFEDMCCKIFDLAGSEYMIVGIKGKSFPLSLGLSNDYACAIELDASEL